MTEPIERIEKIVEFAINGERSTEGLPLSSGFSQRQKPKRLWFNALFYDITRKTNEIIDAVNRLTNQDDPVFQAYAVGDVYTTTLDFKTPEEVATAKGYGTWKRYAEGRTLVGYTTNLDDKAEYAVMGNEFGENEHTLTIEEMPEHGHDISIMNDRNSHDRSDEGDRAVKPNSTIMEGVVLPEGGDQPHNNIQPSIVVAHWLRIA